MTELEDRIESGLAGAGHWPRQRSSSIRPPTRCICRRSSSKCGRASWLPGMTVEQVVTEAGGPRVVATDQFATLLQAYSTIEDFEALLQSIAELEAQAAEGRDSLRGHCLRTFRSRRGAGRSGRAGLRRRLSERCGLPLTGGHRGRSGGRRRNSSQYDIVQFRRLQRDAGDLRFILFSEEIAENVLLADVRDTQQELMADHLALHLTLWNSLALQRAALVVQRAAYSEQKVLVESNLEQLAVQLENVRSLRESGLARESAVLRLQAAYATLVSSRVALLSAIADIDTQVLQQDLSIHSFGSDLRAELGRELENVRRELSEARSREGEARRAATVAVAYRGAEQIEGSELSLSYEILMSRRRRPCNCSTLGRNPAGRRRDCYLA